MNYRTEEGTSLKTESMSLGWQGAARELSRMEWPSWPVWWTWVLQIGMVFHFSVSAWLHSSFFVVNSIGDENEEPAQPTRGGPKFK